VARLIDAYQVGVIDLDDLKQRRDRVADHGRALRERLGEIQRQRREREQEIRLLEGLEGFCASICDALKEPSFEMIQKIVRLVVDRILAEDDRLVIKHIVPAMPFRLRPGSTWPTCPPASATTRIWRLKPQRLSFVLCPYR
jgi:site-specific DNA recombinase